MPSATRKELITLRFSSAQLPLSELAELPGSASSASSDERVNQGFLLKKTQDKSSNNFGTTDYQAVKIQRCNGLKVSRKIACLDIDDVTVQCSF